MQKRNLMLASSGVVLAAAAAPALALDSAITTALTTAFAAVVTDATALSALVMVPIIGVLAVTLVIKLVKRFGNKV